MNAGPVDAGPVDAGPVDDSLATTAEGRSVLRMRRRLDHPPEKVWRAVTEAEHLGAWFPTSWPRSPRG